MGDDAAILLELSATDNLEGFKHAVEYQGFHVDQVGLWYGRRIGSRNMGFQEMTPLLISSIYGSFRVLNYILKTGKVDVNRASVSDGATALHFAAASGLDSSAEVVELLINASADVSAVDVNGNKPIDLIAPMLKKRRKLEMLFRGETDEEEKELVVEKKEYSIDVPLPDINNGIYSTDEFRMYSFKVMTCSRAYSHDWTECPFVHPGENARRRDPTKFQYTCVPCPEFRKGSCLKGDTCEFAHGVFESWLHPAQYRTRLCKDETGCSRKVCFFAHKRDELRPLYASTGSALPSPKTDMTPPPMSPPLANSWTANKPSRLKAARELELELQLQLQLINLENQRQLSGLSSSPHSNRMEPFFTLSSSSSSSSSPVRKSSSPYGFDFDSSSVAMAGMNSRSSAFAGNRSQSFIDRGGAVNNRPVSLGFTAAANSAGLTSSKLAEWGSPDGKLEWGFSKEEEMNNNKLKKSASFGYRNGNVTKTIINSRTTMAPSTLNTPAGLSRVHSNLPWSSAQQFYMFEQEKISA